VLVDSDRISLRIQAQHLRELGLEITVDECMRDFLGLGMPATLRLVADRHAATTPLSA
jgi:beta-phosphoglucomutase-like phosphatase (HAD superfamily)